MASIILAAAGSAIGGAVGGSVLGVSAATIGGAIGSIAGAAVDSWLVASMAPTERIAGQRLDTLQITSSTEGAVNRAESGKFPDTPCEVVAEGCQFSYRCDGRPETLGVRADRDAAFATAKAVLTGTVADPTHGALFFHASRIRPGWFESRTRVGEIGNHVFYR